MSGNNIRNTTKNNYNIKENKLATTMKIQFSHALSLSNLA